jgi:hypothetical protein
MSEEFNAVLWHYIRIKMTLANMKGSRALKPHIAKKMRLEIVKTLQKAREIIENKNQGNADTERKDS